MASQIGRPLKNKNFPVTLCVIIFCVILASFFPTSNAIENISRSILFLVILPVLYIKIILKENLSAYGWNLGKKNLGTILSSIFLVASLAFFYLLLHSTPFSSHYSVNPLISRSFLIFLFYELVLFNIIFFSQTFFFQGFLLFFLSSTGAWSIFIQAAAYTLLILISGQLSWQIFPFIYLSLIGGLLSYKTRSFAYSYIFGLLFIIILDSYVIHLAK